MDEIKEELREETNASVTPTVKRRSRKSKSPVAEPTEPIEANGSISETQGKATGTSRKKKRVSAAATEIIAVAALETLDEPVKEKKRRKSAKAKPVAGESVNEAIQNEVNIPEGQGKVQRVRVQVNGRKSKSATRNTSMCVRAVPEEIPLTMQTESLAMQTPLTNQVRVEAVETTQLPFRAIKVRNVVGKVVDLVTEVICNKVIVQGKVHEQLYFVATDGIIHHLADDIPFSTFIDLPSALPGMNAHVTAVIEEILTEVAPDGLSITKKIIIEVFLKVTETVQVNLLQGHGPVILLDEVVGENTKQLLVENDFDLGFPALKIDEVVGRIQHLESEVIKDKIIIQGILHKQIFFIGIDNIGRHQGEDVPFSLFVDLPGAEPGMDVQLHPRIEGIFYELFSETVLHQKAIIEFFVKVTDTIRHPVTVGHGPLFKVEEFIGENTRQELSETLIELPFAAEKVREIDAKIVNLTSHVICDKVIVQGTIHKQIFYISAADNVERHLAEDIPFSLFLDIPGAVAGDLVRIQPIIEAVFFELESATELRQKVVIAIHAVVAREVQLNLVLSTGPLYKMEQVVGEGTKQELIVRREAIVSPTPPIPPTPPITVSEITIVFPNIAAASQQIILRNEVALPMKAIKVKEILAQILDARYHIIEDGLIVEGIVEKVIVYVGTDNVVHTLTEEVPFSILVSIPGIVPNQPVEVNVEIENISFELNACGDCVVQVIVLKASVSSRNSSGQRVTVVTNVAGPRVVQEKVRVRALVENNATGIVETREFDVVTEVTAPGIAGTEKQTLLLDVVGDGNPNPVPVRVVTRVIFR